MKRETVGKISRDLSQKAPESSSPIEIERSMQQDYWMELMMCIDAYKKTYHSPFFVQVITKNEKLMPNVFRNYFMARQTCPTPDYDQTVFRYNPSDESIEYVWTIPSQEASHHLYRNALMVSPEEKHLLRFVLDFADGELYKLMKKLNGEEMESNMLVN